MSHFLLQSFEKQGFHAGTPAASFSLPSALGSGGPINPPAAAGYAPAPFMHILAPHQQPHSQILHHHLQQDGQVVYRLLLLFVSVTQVVFFFPVLLVPTKKLPKVITKLYRLTNNSLLDGATWTHIGKLNSTQLTADHAALHCTKRVHPLLRCH